MLIPYYWDFIKKYIDDAVEHANGEFTTQDIYDDLMAKRMYLFVAFGPLICGAATCEVVQYKRKTAINVVTVGGDRFESWNTILLDELLKWNDKIGADGIKAFVREGFIPTLENHGFKRICIGVWHGPTKR